MTSEQYAFQLILHSGNARSIAYEALEKAKTEQLEESFSMMEEAKKELIEAQKIHAEMLRIMANDEEEIKIDLLLMHAEDHIASSAVVVDMTKEIITLYQKLEGLDGLK